jgi:pimeloyl-ACP methyl ester carboxylesterase
MKFGERRMAALSDIFYQTYGNPEGEPLIYCHGCPGSHLEASQFHRIALEQNIRIIAFDRPGMGQTPFRKIQNVAEEAELVAELADVLQLGKFAIMGLSGGASTALAAASQMPERLTYCASFVGWAPVHDNVELQKHLAPADRVFLQLSKYFPWAFGLGFAYLGHRLKQGKESILKIIGGSLSEKDRSILADDNFADFFVEDLKLAFTQGSKGPAQDGFLRYKPWGFALHDIGCPVHLYAAAQDQFVPLAFACTMHEAIPASTLHIFEDDGHLTAFRQFHKVATDLQHTIRGRK